MADVLIRFSDEEIEILKRAKLDPKYGAFAVNLATFFSDPSRVYDLNNPDCQHDCSMHSPCCANECKSEYDLEREYVAGFKKGEASLLDLYEKFRWGQLDIADLDEWYKDLSLRNDQHISLP